MTMTHDFSASTAMWLWLFPAAFLVHLAEEYWGGRALSDSPDKMKGLNLSPALFLTLTGFGLSVSVMGIVAAQWFGFPQLLLVSFGVFILINGLSHMITSALKTAYNPGVISGLLIFVPLGIVTLLRLWGGMSERRYWTGIGIGVASHVVVSLLAHGKGKLFARSSNKYSTSSVVGK